MIEPSVFGLLCGVSLVTAAVSAVLGMAGGIMLLTVMLLYLDPIVAIPIHALVQLASNSSRSLIHAKEIRFDLFFPFVLLVLPAGFLTLPLATQIPADALRLAIGIFVLVATWRKSWLLLGVNLDRVSLKPRFAVIGAGSGALGPLIGATGPFIAPFFLGIGLSRFQLIGTKAACQAATHLAKIALFGFAGFAFAQYAWLTIAMASCVVAGTFLGTQVLNQITDDRFTQLYKIALTLVALRLMYSGFGAIGIP